MDSFLRLTNVFLSFKCILFIYLNNIDLMYDKFNKVKYYFLYTFTRQYSQNKIEIFHAEAFHIVHSAALRF